MALQPLFIRGWKQLSAYDWIIKIKSKRNEKLILYLKY